MTREKNSEKTLYLFMLKKSFVANARMRRIFVRRILCLSPSLLSPLSPLLEEANEKWSCHHFLGLDPAQEASLIVEAWNGMLNGCYNDSISSDKDGLTRPSG